MDITFKALEGTDIGRHVNRLRKYPSNDVRQLVELLVRKWKRIWLMNGSRQTIVVKSNPPISLLMETPRNRTFPGISRMGITVTARVEYHVAVCCSKWRLNMLKLCCSDCAARPATVGVSKTNYFCIKTPNS